MNYDAIIIGCEANGYQGKPSCVMRANTKSYAEACTDCKSEQEINETGGSGISDSGCVVKISGPTAAQPHSSSRT